MCDGGVVVFCNGSYVGGDIVLSLVVMVLWISGNVVLGKIICFYLRLLIGED